MMTISDSQPAIHAAARPMEAGASPGREDVEGAAEMELIDQVGKE
jgi:hypothetical protein